MEVFLSFFRGPYQKPMPLPKSKKWLNKVGSIRTWSKPRLKWCTTIETSDKALYMKSNFSRATLECSNLRPRLMSSYLRTISRKSNWANMTNRMDSFDSLIKFALMGVYLICLLILTLKTIYQIVKNVRICCLTKENKLPWPVAMDLVLVVLCFISSSFWLLTFLQSR